MNCSNLCIKLRENVVTREMQDDFDQISKAILTTSGLQPEFAQRHTSPHTATFIFYEGRSGSVGLNFTY